MIWPKESDAPVTPVTPGGRGTPADPNAKGPAVMATQSDQLPPDQHTEDRLAAAAVNAVSSGMLIGLGAGKTAGRAIDLIAQRVRDWRLDIEVVGGSDATERACAELGLRVREFAQIEELDLLIDGADEVDRELRVLKGSRGAITRERMLAWASRRTIYTVDSSKLSDRIGTHATLAVAIIPFGLASTRAAVRRIGLNGVVRRELDGSMTVTDNGNLILDVAIDAVDDLEWAASQLAAIPGIVEHGLFLSEADEVLVEHEDGRIERLSPPAIDPPAGD